MQMQGVAATLDELAAETGWLRRLALSLVNDPAAADDLVQDTYVIAAERGPGDGRPLRPWLIRVLVNLTRMRHRGATRRRAREHAVAELATPPASPAELVDRLELHRVLAELVLQLAPSSRDVVLLHYVEGLSSTEIGNRLGIAAGTVRWRLKQALDELRDRLDQREPKRAWMAALAAFGAPARPAGAAAVKWLVAVAIAIVLAATWLVVRARPTPDPLAGRAHPEVQAVAAGAAPHPARSAGPASPQQGSAGVASPPPTSPGGFVGRVVDRTGQPVEGADVTLSCAYRAGAPLPRVRSSASGGFAFEIEGRCIGLALAAKDGLAAVAMIMPAMGPAVLTLRPKLAVAVHVVDDATGAPIAGAEVIGLFRDLYHDTATTDAAGNASVVFPVPASAAVRAELSARTRGRGYVNTSLTALDGTVRQTLRLARGITIRGRVVGPGDRPVTDAAITVFGPMLDASGALPHVRAGGDAEPVDAEGRFEISVATAGAYQITPETASLSVASFPETNLDVGAAGLSDLVIHLAPRGLEGVAGIVVDAAGAPVAGARVSSPNGQLYPVISDANGRFTLPLGIRRFDLVARLGALASPFVPVETRRGKTTAVTLTLGAAGISGVVVDTAGEPVPGAEVWLNACCGTHRPLVEGTRTNTDDRGRFAIDVPRGDFVLSVRRTSEDDFLDDDDRHFASGSHGVRLVLP